MSNDPHAESEVTVACIQMEPRIGAKQANVERSLALIDDACGRGARLVVLPELCNSGYVFASREEAFAASEPVPNGPTTGASKTSCLARNRTGRRSRAATIPMAATSK